MSIRDVTISFDNTKTGTAVTKDGVSGLVVHAVATASFVLQQMYTLTRLSDLEFLLIDEAYDVTNSTNIFRHVSDYYKKAGDGATFYLIGVAKGLTTMSTYLGGNAFKSSMRQTGYSSGEPSPNSKIKIIGVAFSDDTVSPTAPDVYFSDVIPSMTAIHEAINFLFMENDIRIAVAVIDANNCVSMTQAVDATTLNCNSCFLFHNNIGSSEKSASVGYVLGVISVNSVQFDIGNRELLNIGEKNVYFTDGKAVSFYSNADFHNFGIKNLGFLRTSYTSGYCFHDGSTADSPILALSSIAYRRIAMKLTEFAYGFMILKLGTTPPLGVDGNVFQSYLNGYASEFARTYLIPMQSNTKSNGNDVSVGEIVNYLVNIENVKPFSSTRSLRFTGKFLAPTPISQVSISQYFVISLTNDLETTTTRAVLGKINVSIENENGVSLIKSPKVEVVNTTNKNK